MTEERLAELGVDPRWVALGVLDDAWLSPSGSWRKRLGGKPALDQLAQAVFGFLHHRPALSDDEFAQLLALAVQRDVSLANAVVTWARATPAQLAHAATWAEVRTYATQRLRFVALKAGQPVPVRVVQLGARGPGFAVGTRARYGVFEFEIRGETAVSAEQARELGALLAAIADDEPARCHQPGYGLRLDPDTPDETRISICFECSNMYFDGGQLWAFDAGSPEGEALRDWLARL